MTTRPRPAIRASGLAKRYRVWRSPAGRLIGALASRMTQWTRGLPNVSDRIATYHASLFDEFQALEDISFELHQGDSLGIIGPNGSGKSTLLQIVAGLLAPSEGSVEVYGKVAALLELGSGFNSEFTGRENVFLNGAILGISREELEARFADIAAFADIGTFMDRPIKLYSTGMVMRLAFSVQVHVEPDILIVDEALAVGDAAFQAKAMSKIEQILDRGTTLLFVGHDLNAVRSFCNRAMYIEQGRVITSGDPDEVTRLYMYNVQRARVKDRTGADSRIDKDGRECGINGISFLDASFPPHGRHVEVRYGDPLHMRFRLSLETPIAHPRLFFDVLDGKGFQIAGRLVDIPGASPGSPLTCEVRMGAVLQKGIYRIRVRVTEAPNLYDVTTLRRHDTLLSFEVVDDSRKQFLGMFPLPMDVTWDDRHAAPASASHVDIDPIS